VRHGGYDIRGALATVARSSNSPILIVADRAPASKGVHDDRMASRGDGPICWALSASVRGGCMNTVLAGATEAGLRVQGERGTF